MRALLGMTSKRKRCESPLASPNSLLTADSRDGESLFLDGLLTEEDLHYRLTAPTELDLARRAADDVLETESSVIRFGHLACGTRCVLKETEKPVVAEAVFTRLLNTIRPRSAPAVCHIHTKAVLMERAEPIKLECDAINMLVQIVDMLQTLQLTVRFRHGDLHYGNIVRVRTPVSRHNKHGNAYGPTEPAGGAARPWFNMNCDWTYKLIDFEMSALVTERVVYEVPNFIYTPGSTWSTQHDTRTLVTALYEFWWLSTQSDNRTVVERRIPRGKPNGHGQWFPRFIRGIVAYARAQSSTFDTTLDRTANNTFRDFLVKTTSEAAVKEALHTHPKWYVLWKAYPGGWCDLVGERKGYMPSTHMQYVGGLANDATTIFEPRNLMTMCCWYQSECNRQWHKDKKSRQPWSDVAFVDACVKACE